MRPPAQFPFPNPGNIPTAWANGDNYYWYDGFQGWEILPNSTIVQQGSDPNLPLGGPVEGNYYVSLPNRPDQDLMQFDELFTNPNTNLFVTVSVFNEQQRFRYGEIQVGHVLMPHGSITGTNRGVPESGLQPHNTFDIVDSTLGSGSLHLGSGLLMWSNPGRDGSSLDIAGAYRAGSRPSGVGFSWVFENHYQRSGFGYHPVQNNAPTEILCSVVRTTPIKVCNYDSAGSLLSTQDVSFAVSDNSLSLDDVALGNKQFTGVETLSVNTSGLPFTQSSISNSVVFQASYGYTGVSFPEVSPPRFCGGSQDDSLTGSFDGNCTALDLIESYQISQMTIHDQIQRVGQPTSFSCGSTSNVNFLDPGELAGLQYASVEAGLPKALQLQECSKPRECSNSEGIDTGFLSGFNSQAAHLGTESYSRSDFNGLNTVDANIEARDGHVIQTTNNILQTGGVIIAADSTSATLFSHVHLATINGGS
tara:strand:- start:7216 stop:8646 length:1431 start_codon:yes stop_codon:yes gene_type:complete